MKKLSKNWFYLFATCIVFFAALSPALAFNDDSTKTTAMTGMQVIGGFAILVLAIILPLLKKSARRSKSH